MTTSTHSLLDATATSTAHSIVQLIQCPLPEEERLVLLDAIYQVVRAGLQASLELYRLRLQHTSTN